MVTAERARELLYYLPQDGSLIRRVGRGGERAGAPVSSVHCDGYLSVGIDCKRYLVHRIIWLISYGFWPVGDIDHVDGDRKNNRLDNLREATRSQNNANSTVRSCSKLGLKGVSRAHNSYKFCARIKVNGKQIYLGLHDTPDQAHAAYCAAAKKYHGKFARAA